MKLMAVTTYLAGYPGSGAAAGLTSSVSESRGGWPGAATPGPIGPMSWEDAGPLVTVVVRCAPVVRGPDVAQVRMQKPLPGLFPRTSNPTLPPGFSCGPRHPVVKPRVGRGEQRYGARPARLARVLLEERQRAGIEGRDVLVDRRVRAVLEHHQLRTRDPPGQRVREPGRAHQVVAAEGYLRGRDDPAKLRRGVVAEARPGLAQERVHIRHRTAAHELTAASRRPIRPATVAVALRELEAAALAAVDVDDQDELTGRWAALPIARDPLLDAVDLHGAHDFRHTYATWLEDAGIPARVIDELMGHEASGRGQQRGSAMGAHYRHTTPEMAARVVEAVQQRLAIVLEVAEQRLERNSNRSTLRVF